MSRTTTPAPRAPGPAVLDEMHVGDIRGALGTIARDDVAARRGLGAVLRTLLAIVGPGLIVLVGDNDAGAFATYGQAGQNYGTRLLWTLPVLVPVLYVNQEMVVRLGAVTGVGHARLILERFGRFWGAFSVVDLFVLNALTIVTEFIGITLAAGYLGVPRLLAVALSAAVIVAAACTGSFRRFEQLAVALCLGSLLLVPLAVMAHPGAGRMVHDFFVPSLPGGSSQLSTVMLLVIGIVGTTVAPWQLFFQQSYIIDKRITPRFIRYERADLWIGMVVVVLGGSAIMAAAAAAFAGTSGFGNFTDSAGLATGIAAYTGRAAGVVFAIALLDASIIGAFAVSLSTSYALGDVLGLRHSLHRGIAQAKGFYAVYALLIVLAAAAVTVPGVPLGLLTQGVQVLAGVLLPSASVFLLLLCNDRAVLGPWVNGRVLNALTSVIVAVLVTLSVVLTAAVLFPDITAGQIVQIMIGCALVAAVTLGAALVLRRRGARHGVASSSGTDLTGTDPVGTASLAAEPAVDRSSWRMPALSLLGRAEMSLGRRIGLAALRGYLVVAMLMVVVKIVQEALAR